MFFTLLAQAQTRVPTTVVNKVVESTLPATPGAATTATDTAMSVAPTAAAAVDMDLWSRVFHAHWLVQLTLLILFAFSVGCWAIIIYKYMQVQQAQKASLAFWSKFSKTGNLGDVALSKGMQDGPMYEIFVSGHESLGRIKKATNQYTDYYREYLTQRMHQAKEAEMDKLEQYIGFLATTAAVAPFIGLFGTVWGILSAFLAIAKDANKVQATLTSVGPHIAEALVVTAVGLLAAIPAVIAYNYFVARIRSIGKLINIFVNDFMLKSEREISS